jgi:hypothetical protein
MQIDKSDFLPQDLLWFGDRMHESHTGRVLVPSHCYAKFRKLADNEFLSNQQIKDWLIDNVYLENGWYKG